ncbi:MAG: NFACT family protein, partial [Candidatus Zixiibacteriota bacterium]
MHIRNLVVEFQKEMTGEMKIVSTEFYKKERTACFFMKAKGKSLQALVYSYHPSAYGFYLAPASKVKMATREKPWPVFGLDGAMVVGITQLGLDRIVRLEVEQGGKKGSVIFEALGANGNAWYVDAEGGLAATLRNRDFTFGRRYEPPPPLTGLNPFEITVESFGRVVRETAKSTTLAFFIEKHVLGFNRTLALEAVQRAGLDFVETSAIDDISAMDNLCTQIKQIARWFETGAAGYLYTVRRAHEAYPFKLKITEQEPEKFKTLSLAVMALAERRQAGVEEADEEKQVLALVERAIKKIQMRVPKLEQDIAEASGYELYKKQGELLKINMDRLEKGMTEIEVDDIFAEPREKMRIPLDKALAPKDNIENYFKKYRKGREGLQLLQRRLEITRGEYEELLKMLADLENHFERAVDKYKNEIASLAPRAAQMDETGPRL